MESKFSLTLVLEDDKGGGRLLMTSCLIWWMTSGRSMLWPVTATKEEAPPYAQAVEGMID